MKFGIYNLGSSVLVDSDKYDGYDGKSGIILKVTKNGWHTVLVEGSKELKLRTNQLKKGKSKPTKKKSKPTFRRSLKKTPTKKRDELIKKRDELPFLFDLQKPKSRKSRKSRKSKKKSKYRPPIAPRPTNSSILEQARRDAQARINDRGQLMFLKDIKHEKPKYKKYKKPRKSKKKRRDSYLKQYRLNKKRKTQNAKLRKETLEKERIFKIKQENERRVLEYSSQKAAEDSKRERPPLDIGSAEFDPKSIVYSFETTNYMRGNKYIKSLYIGDSRFYGHTVDGLVIDADLYKVTDFGLEEPRGQSIVFFWTDGQDNNQLKFNFDSKKEFDDFYSHVYYEVYPEGQEEEYYV
jgi:hypothetical protein